MNVSRRSLLKALAVIPFWGLAAQADIEPEEIPLRGFHMDPSVFMDLQDDGGGCYLPAFRYKDVYNGVLG